MIVITVLPLLFYPVNGADENEELSADDVIIEKDYQGKEQSRGGK